MLIEELVNFIITILAASGAGVLIAAFLAKRFVNHQLNKNIEEFKSRLLVKQSLGIERKKYAFQEEVAILKELWKLVDELAKICGSYDANKTGELQSQHDQLEEYLRHNEPFVNAEIANKCSTILQLTDPEAYEDSEFSAIKKEINGFISIYRSRLLLD